MHESAFDKFQVFVSAYLAPAVGRELRVLDVGARVIDDHISHRGVIESAGWTYTGLDIEPGTNVDVVAANPHEWSEIASDDYDVVLCSQVLEHTRFPWRVAQEIARVLKPRGMALLVAPSAGPVHRFPEDCFRYYPDGLPSLAAGAGLRVVESHVQHRVAYESNLWCDAALAAQKPLLTPEQAGLERARLALAGLSARPTVRPADLETVDFSPYQAQPSVLADAPSLGAFATRDDELARRYRLAPRWRALTRAVRGLTR